jgi:hypothetical protein
MGLFVSLPQILAFGSNLDNCWLQILLNVFSVCGQHGLDQGPESPAFLEKKVQSAKCGYCSTTTGSIFLFFA